MFHLSFNAYRVRCFTVDFLIAISPAWAVPWSMTPAAHPMVVGTILNSTSDVRQHRGTYFLPLILIALLRPHSLDSVHEPFSVLGIKLVRSFQRRLSCVKPRTRLELAIRGTSEAQTHQRPYL
ncbi:hypothetical protein K443DRAFT_206504 [Laccaria amethystina LaAM-08-1]|uniref:Uncharacterized protein n=1 Tax=Laccaria amethystina LaAM-08-1 TaxID=1095629 RepID=A0A0C9X0B8_9AGAR|nr:hypothetical protein K443DRAFT_206504 [Laccaria amethystina LaAM-08-1]